MPSGKLWSADLAAGVNTLVYPAPADKVVTANIRICNRNASPVKVRLAIGTGGAPAAGDYLEYDVQIPASGILDNTGIVLSAGENVWIRSDTANVSTRGHGFVEPA